MTSSSPTFIDFRWPVASAGYKFADGIVVSDDFDESAPPEHLGEPEPCLVEAPDLEFTPDRTMELADHPALFREFARLPSTCEGIQVFASSFGFLGGKRLRIVARRERTLRAPTPGRNSRRRGTNSPTIAQRVGRGEPLSGWIEEIKELHSAVDIWDRARSGDDSDLRNSVVVEGESREDRGGAPSHGALGPIATLLNPFDRNDALISDRIPPMLSRRLPTIACYLVSVLANSRFKTEVFPQIVWNERTGTSRLALVPGSLRAALWLQLADAVSAGKTYRSCLQCGKDFELSAAAIRTSRMYCSESCRGKAYRVRQARAAQMHADGFAIEEIALELDAEVEAVAAWVEGKRRKRSSKKSEEAK